MTESSGAREHPVASDGAAHDLRAPERELLWARLEAPSGRTVVLSGPRGVGKTELVQDLARRVQGRGRALVLEGRVEGPGSGSFAPFPELLRQAIRWTEQAGLTERLVDPLLGALEPVLSRGDDAGGRAPIGQKLELFEAARRLLAGVAEHVRLLVVVHGIERADGDTLELALYLAESLFPDPLLDPRSLPGLLVLVAEERDATERPSGEGSRLARSARLDEFLADAGERRNVELVRLSGLDLDGLRRYLSSPRVLERLMSASAGLPQSIEEILDAIPNNVEQLFRRRLDGYGPLHRRALEALALFERSATPKQLAQVIGEPVREVFHALGELRSGRVLERQIVSGEICYAFARRRNLEVTLQGIEPELQVELNGRWAEVLAADPAYAGQAALLAHHRLRSPAPTTGVEPAVRAAEAHAVAGAFDAASRLLGDALPHASRDQRLAILERLSELATLRGRPREAMAHFATFKAELPPSELDRALLREADLTNLAGDHARTLELLLDAEVPTESRPGADRALAEAFYQLGRLDEARARAEAALASLDGGPAGELKLRVDLVNLLGKIALAADELGKAERLFEATLHLAQRGGLPRDEARARVNLGLTAMRVGEGEAAEAHLLAGIELARGSHELSHLAFGHLNLGVLAHQKGKLTLAIEHYRAAQSIFRRLGNRTQLARVLYNLANLFFLVGELDRAAAVVAEALRLARESASDRLLGIATALDAAILADRGELGSAHRRLLDAIAEAKGDEPPHEALLDLAFLELKRNDLPAAEALKDELARALERSSDARLLARARFLGASVAVARGDEVGLVELERLADEVGRLDLPFLARDVHAALARGHLRSGRAELARRSAEAARATTEVIARELSPELADAFRRAGPQRELAALFAELEAGAPALASAPPPRRPTRLPRPTRPEWARRYGAIVGDSPRLTKVFHILERIANSDATVLVLGESGTGKELIAEALHQGSPRARGPFVKVNCAALVESLLLSELFGHERGSFTGAHQRKAGRFEMAAGGTVFLDEIGDISAKTQVALLRVLQEREFERVGGGRPIRLEARVICATNRNLPQMVKDGLFREDLYYRLKGLTVELPPLRERREDVAPLAQHFLERHAAETGTPLRRLSPDAVRMLSRYDWPGNVRELENVIRSVALFADGETIERRDFDEYRELFEDRASLPPPSGDDDSEDDVIAPLEATLPPPDPTEPLGPRPVGLARPPSVDPRPPSADASPRDPATAILDRIFDDGIPLAEIKRRIQDEAIAQALTKAQGNITRAADLLGMKRPRLSQIINASDELKALCQGGTK